MGTLHVVATPIGNLGDISPRAEQVLRSARVVVAEDPRHSRRLLDHLGVRPQLISLPAPREVERVGKVLAALEGSDVALISDAGTPGISDPGRRLVAAARAAGHQVLAIPGPSAVVAAVAASGLRADRFAFLGFLPRTRGRMARVLGSAPDLALVFFESPQRLAATLALCAELLPDRQVAVAREISKLHESWHLGTAAELAAQFRSVPARGECTVVVEAPARGARRG
jgi:16S rRNA (cytidine1402-2'-O)-methyltransferase